MIGRHEARGVRPACNPPAWQELAPNILEESISQVVSRSITMVYVICWPMRFSPSLTTYLTACLIGPVLVLILLAGAMAWHNFDRYGRAEAGLRAISLAKGGGDLIHRLQIERATSVGAVNSNDQRFTQALPDNRAAVDAARATLSAGAAGQSASVAELIGRIDARVATIAATRAAVDGRQVAAGDVAAWFTETIAQILGLVPQLIDATPDARAARATSAYVALLVAKERTGQERALLVQMFSSDRATPQQLQRWATLRGMQDTRFDAFNGFATAALRDRLASTRATETALAPFRAAVQQALVNSASAASLGQDAAAWFQAITTRIGALKEIEDAQTAELAAFGEEARSEARTALVGGAIATLVGLLSSVAVTILILRRLRGIVGRIVADLEWARTERDLTRALDGRGVLELDRIAVAFNGLIVEVSTALARVQGGAEAVRASAETLDQAASGVETAMATSDRAASGANEAVHGIAEHLGTAASAAEELAATTSEIAAAASQTTARMQQGNQCMQELDATVGVLSESSRSIGTILQVIAGIAEQTNLLALNATIEAARAGETGRGFAVVASEVKELARQSGSSAADISKRVQEVQQAIERAAAVAKRLSEALAAAGQAQQSIGAAMEEQHATSGELARTVQGAAGRGDAANQAVRQVSGAAAGARVAVASAREAIRSLSTLAAEVTDVANRFRIPKP